jgi:hypothetical protein
MKNALRIALPMFLVAAVVAAPAYRAANPGSGPAVWPIIPIICQYQYAPQYFTEWIDDNPQYSMIEAEVKEGDPPIYEMVLTEKKGGRRVYYCNAASWVEYLKSIGSAANLTKIDFKAAKSSGEQPTYAFGFRDEKGQAIIWRFIGASEPGEQGAGLNPLGDMPGLMASYRDIATLAGQGSAVQIGDKVSEAASWPEVSQPPYFVAYHGAFAVGLHMGGLTPGTQSWKVTKSPDALQQGGQWEMTDDHGASRQLTITAVKGDELTIAQTNHSLSGDLRLTALKTAQGLALESLGLADEKHSMKISFKPALSLPMPGGSAAGAKSEVAFQIDEDGHRKVIEGKIDVEPEAGGARLTWKPESPGWAKKHVLTASLIVDSDGYKIAVQ